MAEDNRDFREETLKAISALQLVGKDLYNEINLLKFTAESLNKQVSFLNNVVRDGDGINEPLTIKILRLEQELNESEKAYTDLVGDLEEVKKSADEHLENLQEAIDGLETTLLKNPATLKQESIKGRWELLKVVVTTLPGVIALILSLYLGQVSQASNPVPTPPSPSIPSTP